mmetsp:Transcript_7187/g.13134  ORF Transcript_7187/g.13134 Transcript_7187/m.13134 type:complete len:237 (-) Transcript_7187:50-760(-)
MCGAEFAKGIAAAVPVWRAAAPACAHGRRVGAAPFLSLALRVAPHRSPAQSPRRARLGDSPAVAERRLRTRVRARRNGPGPVVMVPSLILHPAVGHGDRLHNIRYRVLSCLRHLQHGVDLLAYALLKQPTRQNLDPLPFDRYSDAQLGWVAALRRHRGIAWRDPAARFGRQVKVALPAARRIGARLPARRQLLGLIQFFLFEHVLRDPRVRPRRCNPVAPRQTRGGWPLGQSIVSA